MVRVARVAAGFAAAAAVAGGTVVGAPAAFAASCGQTLSPTVSGGKATWTVNCTSNGYVYASGWVEDTAADGKCAAVKFNYPDGSTWATTRACPSGTRVYFTSPSRPGRLLDGYLTVT
jgi:hypothetical protein